MDYIYIYIYFGLKLGTLGPKVYTRWAHGPLRESFGLLGLRVFGASDLDFRSFS